LRCGFGLWSFSFKLILFREAILKTIAYADVFDFPLTYNELRERLIGEKVKEKIFDASLEDLVRSGELIKTDIFYHFPYRADLPEKRRRAKFYSEEKSTRAKKVSKLLKIVPWIKMIGVTGAVAAENSGENDDIDFLIVIARKRVWLTRFLVVMILKLTNSYRSEKHPNNRICPNIFLSEDKLSWEEEKRDIYVANEVTLLKPIYERGQTYLKFLSSNLWCLDLLPNFDSNLSFSQPKEGKPRRTGVIGNLIEIVAMRFQLWYMRNKKTSEITDRDLIHFRKKDNRVWILKKYQERLDLLSIRIKVPKTIAHYL